MSPSFFDVTRYANHAAEREPIDLYQHSPYCVDINTVRLHAGLALTCPINDIGRAGPVYGACVDVIKQAALSQTGAVPRLLSRLGATTDKSRRRLALLFFFSFS